MFLCFVLYYCKFKKIQNFSGFSGKRRGYTASIPKSRGIEKNRDSVHCNTNTFGATKIEGFLEVYYKCPTTFITLATSMNYLVVLKVCGGTFESFSSLL